MIALSPANHNDYLRTGEREKGRHSERGGGGGKGGGEGEGEGRGGEEEGGHRERGGGDREGERGMGKKERGKGLETERQDRERLINGEKEE